MLSKMDPAKTGLNSCAPERLAAPARLFAPVVCYSGYKSCGKSYIFHI